LSGRQKIHVAEREILDFLLERLDDEIVCEAVELLGDGCELEIVCEEVTIAYAQISGGVFQITDIACDRPEHGVHDRYKCHVDKLIKAGVIPSRVPAECPKCGGSAMIPVDTAEGRKLIVLAQGMMMFKGFRLADDGYQPKPPDVDVLRGSIDEFINEGLCAQNGEEDDGL